MNQSGFTVMNKFYDTEHFPVGFSRSGEFTIAQAQALETHGRCLQAIELGAKVPETDEERNFLAVCHGLKEAETVAEKAWLKYKQACQTKFFVPSLSVASYPYENVDVGGDFDI